MFAGVDTAGHDRATHGAPVADGGWQGTGHDPGEEAGGHGLPGSTRLPAHPQGNTVPPGSDTQHEKIFLFFFKYF